MPRSQINDITKKEKSRGLVTSSSIPFLEIHTKVKKKVARDTV